MKITFEEVECHDQQRTVFLLGQNSHHFEFAYGGIRNKNQLLNTSHCLLKKEDFGFDGAFACRRSPGFWALAYCWQVIGSDFKLLHGCSVSPTPLHNRQT
jgi:hypothetical protein